MLVFGMNGMDYVVINGNIMVRMQKEGNEVKLCIEAPREVMIERDRVYEKRCFLEGIRPKWQFDGPAKEKRKHFCQMPAAQNDATFRKDFKP